jgi:phage/plasmid-like protein (TIGR03299 family)
MLHGNSSVGGASVADEVMGLGGAKTADEMLQIAGLDWKVGAYPMTIQRGGKGAAVPNHHAIVREDNGVVLGVQTRHWTPIQNTEAFRPVDDLVRAGEARYTGGGIIDGGARVWVRVALNRQGDVTVGDVVRGNLFFVNGHDGGCAYRGVEQFERLVCLNGMTSAESLRMFSRRHVQSITSAQVAGEVRSAMERSLAGFGRALAAYRALVKKRMTEEAARAFVRSLFPAPKPEAKIAQRNLDAKVDAILHAALTSPGHDLPGVRGTAWGLLNGVTYYVDHVRGAEGRDESTAVKQNVLGDGAKLKTSAMQRLLATV